MSKLPDKLQEQIDSESQEDKDARRRLTNAMIDGYNKIVDEFVPIKKRGEHYQKAWNVAVELGLAQMTIDCVRDLLLSDHSEMVDFFYRATKSNADMMRDICGTYADKSLPS